MPIGQFYVGKGSICKLELDILINKDLKFIKADTEPSGMETFINS